MLRSRLNKATRNHIRSNLIGYIALFFALSTGGAVALNGSNTVFSRRHSTGRPVNGGRRSRRLRAGSDVVDNCSPAVTSTRRTSRPPRFAHESPRAAARRRSREPASWSTSAPSASTGTRPRSGPPPPAGPSTGSQLDDYPCNDNGQNCINIYARSVAGVKPSGSHHLLPGPAGAGQLRQAPADQRRVAASGRRHAGLARPEHRAPARLANTGANAACVSNWGVNDMVGNLWEWVGDWVPASTNCPGWGAFSEDAMCLSGASRR